MTQRINPSRGALPVDHARHYLGGLSRGKFYELLKDGELITFTIGRRRFASIESLDSYIRRREQESNQ
jgi:hypothetical protein